MTSDELKTYYRHRIERAKQEAFDAELALQVIDEADRLHAEAGRLRTRVQEQAEIIKSLEARLVERTGA